MTQPQRETLLSKDQDGFKITITKHPAYEVSEAVAEALAELDAALESTAADPQ